MAIEPIPLPTPERLCCLCSHSYIGDCGIFCAEYREFIANETAAEDCESWDPR